MDQQIIHVPVLLQEVLVYLKPEPKKVFIDGTVGQGGHAFEILKRVLPEGRLLAIDRDPHNLEIARDRLADYTDAVIFVCGSFAECKKYAYASKYPQVDGILLDLGFSSYHIQDPARGFSFLAEGVLDMRYNPEEQIETAADIVNTWSEEELAEIFRKYGEERQARSIAQAIIKNRKQKKIITTKDLSEVVQQVVKRHGKVHPATKVFQALRIAVNDELGEIERALPDLVELLKPGGRLVIISFHSLEDRLIKQFIKEHSELDVLTKKPVCPTEEEIRANPRARSAKLRVAQKRFL
ncbi:MAG: Ribosomal RNA small subunit methyltransferase H [Candidatus Uhrbacteria bacterium GW2011_GWE2_40_58]|nr:MAG: Ribosomal RNA small subunit methyltransferase H [Candidatus Uhrbacteria bacterium GW2011_GWF2_40_263]KKR67317.1 MAG: Ribosomal RNA small subunit methyltransferase H [Candidatus Uhrbacteria bacterium GW2011_GWE2_40_58]OGL92390.1 MAG: 16S rRNA (cytosine(1402)-N(4))-methyltransferase [Candidatus Uhrbacteria bacterium RIFOXYA2_FULL_40_9]OGL96981.1 MAG: 16S rRNA (cytosine(1402)-N(4))-methyltransferase [Candidatus Uhrbacteria bacterium RIFOXYB2_FULL_41_18]HBK34784.1 16S rRNA (cytosine(1402)-N